MRLKIFNSGKILIVSQISENDKIFWHKMFDFSLHIIFWN